MVDQRLATQSKQRQLLEAATDEVTDLVLKNNQDGERNNNDDSSIFGFVL